MYIYAYVSVCIVQNICKISPFRPLLLFYKAPRKSGPSFYFYFFFKAEFRQNLSHAHTFYIYKYKFIYTYTYFDLYLLLYIRIIYPLVWLNKIKIYRRTTQLETRVAYMYTQMAPRVPKKFTLSSAKRAMSSF